MPKNLTPQNRWEDEFQVPLPGEPRNIGPLETLFQRLLNRTERLKNRIADILGVAWDATPPDTLAGVHNRVARLENPSSLPALTPVVGGLVVALGTSGLGRVSLGTHVPVSVDGEVGFNGVDWNTLGTHGVYRVTDAGTGGANPPPAAYRHGVLIVARGGQDAVAQIYVPHDSGIDPFIYVRQRWVWGGWWSGWVRLGVQYGQNTNGRFARFGDGTQVAWFSVDDADGGIYTWVFPAAFSAAPTILATASVIGGNENWSGKMLLATSNTTSASIYPYNNTNTAALFTGAIRYHLMAIGRWL
ncbi:MULTISPECIES: pyocin knob domain-containing protein [Thermus]|uniref:pyocin knob domain-containing protein n=1 Tax=Thermus TaxID=270 RepID=UPI001F3BF912|nr:MULTISPECIES: pyocin knob domain-containing protein [Thermus]